MARCRLRLVLAALLSAGVARGDIIAQYLGEDYGEGAIPESLGPYRLTPFISANQDRGDLLSLPSPFGGQLSFDRPVFGFTSPFGWEPHPYVVTETYHAPDRFTMTLPDGVAAVVFSVNTSLIYDPSGTGEAGRRMTVTAGGTTLTIDQPVRYTAQTIGLFATGDDRIRSVSIGTNGERSVRYSLFDIGVAQPIAPAPEPGTLGLIAVGAGCLGGWRFRRRR